MRAGSERPSSFLYLSPHLDDVVLSVGGLVRAQVQSGARVVVASFCTADPPADRPLGALARRFHASWSPGSAPRADRRGEDRDACAVLGAEPRHLALLDAIYRAGREPPGEYRALEELFGAPAAWDREFTDCAMRALLRLIEELAPAAVYGPLAVGSHVDHVQVLRALWSTRDRLGAPLWLYEDQPYSAGIYPRPQTDALCAARAACPFALEPELHAVDLAARSAAIRCYRSQLAELFGADLAGLDALEAYGRSLRPDARPAERIWRATGPRTASAAAG